MMEVYSVLSPTYDEEVSSPDWVYRVRKITTRMGNEYIQEVSSNESGTFSFKPWKKIVYEELTSGRATFNDTNGGTYAARSVIWKRFNHVVVVDFYDISMTPKVTNSQSSVLATGLPKAKHNGTTMISSINGQAKRVGIVGGSTSIVWWWTGTVTANSPALSGQLVYICE